MAVVSRSAAAYVLKSGASKLSNSDVVDGYILPTKVILFQNHPNPFIPETTIPFTVKKLYRVILKVFDICGRELATLMAADQQAGQ